MRTMIRVSFPVERSNQATKNGSLGTTMESFLKQYKPEAAYFYPENGKRAAMFVLDLPDTTHVARTAEMFFHGLDADVTMTPVMNADDLKAGLGKAMEMAMAR